VRAVAGDVDFLRRHDPDQVRGSATDSSHSQRGSAPLSFLEL